MHKSNMTFIRLPKNSNYTRVSNCYLEDKRLSAKDKGLLTFLLSRSDRWYLCKKALNNYFCDGRDALNTAFNNLEKYGYISVKKTKRSCIVECEYTINEAGDGNYETEKQTSGPDLQVTSCGKSSGDDVENPPILITDINTNILTTDTVSSSLNDISVKVKDYVEKDLRLKLTDNFYDDFIRVCLKKGIKDDDICNYLKWIVDTRSKTVPKMAGFIYKTAGEVTLIDEYLTQTHKNIPVDKKTVKVICNKCGKEQSYAEKVQGFCFTCGTEHYNYTTKLSEVHDGK